MQESRFTNCMICTKVIHCLQEDGLVAEYIIYLQSYAERARECIRNFAASGEMEVKLYIAPSLQVI